MKPILVYLLLLSSIMVACKKKFTQFELNYSTEATVPSTLGQFIPISLMTPTVSTNSTYQFEVNDTKKKYIKSIFLKDLQLEILTPDGETFSFLNNIEVHISSPNFPEKLVAYKNNIPSNVGKTLSCDLNSVDLQNYIKEDNFNLRLFVESDETIPQDVQIKIDMGFLVEAQLKK